MYQFIQQQSRNYPVDLLCQTMGVSRSAYYCFVGGQTYQAPESDEQQEARIVHVFKEHKRRYGTRRIVKELQAQGHRIGRNKVRNVMAMNGLVPIQPRSFVPRTTDSRHTLGFNINLLLSLSALTTINQVWVSDITYIGLANGEWAYLTVWMDLFSRRIVSWHLALSMDEDLVITAFKRAALARQPAPGLIAHSDRGGQYASKNFRLLLGKWQCRQSMSRADDPYDNAFAESYWSRLKAELIEGGAFLSLDDARLEIGEYIDNYYNTIRRHSSLGYVSPMQFEASTKG